MEKLHKILPLNFHPQQNTFYFDEICFSSEFDSGNLQNVIKIDENTVKIFYNNFFHKISLIFQFHLIVKD